MDKILMLSEIKKHYGIKSNAEFARFLEISAQNIYTWIKRNTFDPKIILAKCPDINAEWLLTGKGEMLKASHESRPNATSAPKNYLAQYTDEELDQILQDQYRAHLLQMYEQGKAYPEIVVKKMMAEKDIQIKELQREVWELQKKLKQTADNDTIVAKDGKAE